MPKLSGRAQWNTANARLANKPFDDLFIGNPKVVGGKVLCVSILADGNETTSLFSLAEIRKAIKDAAQQGAQPPTRESWRKDDALISDGEESISAWCPNGCGKTMQVVRLGKFQCSVCG